MSWIKDNKFIVALGGGTLVGVAVLYFVGSAGTKRYDDAKAKYDETSTEASGFEKLALYPKAENRDGKRKAIDEYRKSVDSIQAAFENFRPKDIKNISPQDFTSHLKAADQEIRKAFEDAGTTVPDAFFAGFEGYRSNLAPPSSTGMLDYQLNSIKKVLLELAKADPSALKNLYRPALQEETPGSEPYSAPAGAVARPLPLEITFMGSEKSARDFLSSIVKPENQFVVIRSVRIANAKKDPPKTADAQFEKAAAAKPAAASDFGGGFVLPGDEPKPAGGEKPAEAKPASSTAPANSSRILAQVLGNEEVQVFVRLDILQFLPVKKLP